MKTPEQIADMIWGHHGLGHEETMFDHMTWEDFVAWIKEQPKQKTIPSIEINQDGCKKLTCQACGIEKDMDKKEIYPYDTDQLNAEVPIDPIIDIACHTGTIGDKYRVANVCHECFTRLDPDMWISKEMWENLNPIVPFDDLPFEE